MIEEDAPLPTLPPMPLLQNKAVENKKQKQTAVAVTEEYRITIVDATEGSEVSIYSVLLSEISKFKYVKAKLHILLEQGDTYFENVTEDDLGLLGEDANGEEDELANQFMHFMDKVCSIKNRLPHEGLTMKQAFSADWVITRACV